MRCISDPIFYFQIPLSSDGKHYWSYMDPSISEPLLDTIITEFLKILNRCPTRLRKLKNYRVCWFGCVVYVNVVCGAYLLASFQLSPTFYHLYNQLPVRMLSIARMA